VLRRWGWFAALAPLGMVSVAYVVVVRGFVAGETVQGLVWPLLGIVPLFAFGIWLLTVSTSRSALFIAVTGTAIAVGTASETFVLLNPDVVRETWFPVFNLIGLTSGAVASAAFISMFATFPTGIPERRWQRVAVWVLWVPVPVAPLSLVVTPNVLVSSTGHSGGESIPNAFAVPALAWAAPAVEWILTQWPAVFVGLAVLLSRAFFGDAALRARIRVMTWVVLAVVASWSLWITVPSPLVEVAVFVTLAAIPVAAVHGILRFGAFDLAPGARAQFVARSSTVLITVLYAIAVAAPGLLLLDSLTVIGGVLLTTLVAVTLLPLRAWLQQRIHRLVFGDRDRQFDMLSELGARLEQAGEPRDLLARLAGAVRDGLDASWVRIRLVATDGALAESPVGVAGQAAASVANVRLTARLAEQLDELTASRERLVGAQDDERRRLERDLHDGVQQNVVAQIAGLRLARNRLERGELTPDELVELQDQARETLTDLREIARGIHPPVLSDNGLVAAVESGVARYPIPLVIEADDAVRTERYPDDVETTAYYVVREALANTAKHANATHAAVGLSRDDGRLRIAIADDGGGIDPPGAGSASHGGLANIRDRVAALRGTMSVAPNRPSGTRVVVELPIDPARAPLAEREEAGVG
jgi:signal transduction histidine kinase